MRITSGSSSQLVALVVTPSDAEIVSRTRAFLDAYASDRANRVASMVDPASLAIYGSDASEFCGDVGCLRRMLADDFRL